MRERRNYNKRKQVHKTNEVKRRFFLVYEGAKTEDIYFNEINNSREELQIDPLIDIIPLERAFVEKNESNPKVIVDKIINHFFAENKKATIGNYKDLIICITDYLKDEEDISDQAERNILAYLKFIVYRCLDKTFETSIDENEVESIMIAVVNYYNSITNMNSILIENINEYLNSSSTVFDPEIDKICLIVDRDRKSFTKEQYKYVLEQCEKYKVDLYVTNPCFEFWILLHFDDYNELLIDQLFKNEKYNNKTYAEREVIKRMPNFKKGIYDAKSLMPNVKKAIEREHGYCENVRELDNNVGSNIGVLLTKMMDDDHQSGS